MHVSLINLPDATDHKVCSKFLNLENTIFEIEIHSNTISCHAEIWEASCSAYTLLNE